MNIKQIPLSKGQFIDEVAKKQSIIFHHTAGSKNGANVVSGWEHDDRGPIGTAYVISYDGCVIQCFDDSKWAYALGVKQANYRDLEKHAVQIELCSWGFLRKSGNDYINDYGGKVDPSEVCILDTPFKGSKYYHKYSDAQIASLKELVMTICEKHGIKGSLGTSDFALSKQALTGATGFWTHNSFRTDKTDIYPDPRILETFKKGWHAKYSS